MPIWLLGLVKYLPGIGALIDKFVGGDAEAEKIRAQVELVEAEAFKRGRIAPRYMKGYVMIGAFALVVALILASAFFPEASSVADAVVDSVARAGKALVGF
ncbi:MAG: hypothetical protein RBR41_02355 [Desulfovibrio sp.]|uniref:hypothetical protein n=1 Tax=Desulfovibrio sp. TaxID=885 RepID=UPI002A36CE78|nr:hypothetical protein [Desulfovibrio sp.]MDY0258493.1 hypothetical protein [Desulfovibrio sp.]